MLVGDAGQVRYVDGRPVHGGLSQLLAVGDRWPIAVWTSAETSGTRIWSTRARGDDAWAPAHPAAVDLPGATARVDAVADRNGGALVVTLQSEGDAREHWATRVDPQGRPGVPVPFDLGLGSSYVLSRDETGAPLLAWPGWSPSGVWISRYEGDRWTPPERVAADQTGTGVYDVFVASNGRGALTVLWVQDLSGIHPHSVLKARRWAPSGWTPPEDVSSIGWFIQNIHVACGARGLAVALWNLNVGGPVGIASAFSADGLPWTSEPFVRPAVTGGVHAVGVDGGGGAVALWVERVAGGSAEAIWATRRTSAGWGALERIGAHVGTWSNVAPILAVGEEGTALAAWHSRGTLWWNDLRRDGTWGSAQPVASDGTTDVLGHQALMAQGAGWLAWSAYDGTRIRIWAARTRE